MSGDYPDRALEESADILFRVTIKADASLRTKLPDEVVQKTCYRDIRVDYAIAAKLS